MYIAAIETATRAASVAVSNGEKFTEITQDSKLTHSETLLSQFKQVIQMASVTKEMVGAIAVSIGPGSFTGLRIGLATAKALSYAWNIPIIGVSTLQVLAYHFPQSKVLTMIDAQKNRAYVQMFERLKAVNEIEISGIEEAIEKYSSSTDELIINGDILHKIKEVPANVKLAPINLRMPRAINVAMIAREKIEVNEVDNVMNIEPLYIRRSEAEVLWEKRNAD